MKYFIITIDTEGDNLWNWKPGDAITTNNTIYLYRFQELCNKYGYKPVWLTNYEMISDPQYVEFIKRIEKEGQGELGMHLHAWNTPPEYNLEICQDGAPYLIEYPQEIISRKIETMTNILYEKTGIKPVSHRAGRWAMNQIYFDELIKNGYLVDCSVTPYVDWKSSVGQTQGSTGADYIGWSEKAQVIDGSNGQGKILEVPMSIRPIHSLFLPENVSFKSVAKSFYYLFKGDNLWMRPNGYNLRQMKYLINRMEKDNCEYVMFMLHSSELMPGGSPTFKTNASIEKLYLDLEKVFGFASEHGYKGITLRDYAKIKMK